MKSLKAYLAKALPVSEDTPLLKLTPEPVIYDGDYGFVYSEDENRMVEKKNCFKGTRGEIFIGFHLDESSDKVTSFFVFRPTELKFGGALYKVSAESIFVPESGEDV